MRKIVLTGAAGNLGTHLRQPLTGLADELVSSDIVDDIGELYPGETYIQADLADKQAILSLLQGAEMVVHFGAVVDELPFEELLGPNFIGAYNIWESAHQNGLRRVVYASSIHAVGMYSNQQTLELDVAHRPDTFYGLAKCFAEDIARMYWDKRGIESVCIRILSCTDVTNPRALSTWLSYGDLVLMVDKAVTARTTGFSTIYGVSNNDRTTVSNAQAAHLGYRPEDNAEQFAEQILADAEPVDLDDPAMTCVGGPFASTELGVSPMAAMGLARDD